MHPLPESATQAITITTLPTGLSSESALALITLCETMHATLVCLLPEPAPPKDPPLPVVDWLAPRFNRGF
jgi:hypothetical protein